jgi:hypothetical protein
MLGIGSSKRKTGCRKLVIGSSEKKKVDAASMGLVLAVLKEKTRCWEAWHWQFGKNKIDAGKLGNSSTAVWKEKLDAGKLIIFSTERKNLMLRSFVLAVGKENQDAGKLVLAVRKEKLDAGNLGIDSSEKKNSMQGSLILAVSKEKTGCWEACYLQFRKKKQDAGKLGLDFGSSKKN